MPPQARTEPDLDRLFHPRAIAVIGASDSPGSQSALNHRLLRRWVEDRGIPVHPVNPNRAEVDGARCYPSITDVPSPVDVAVVLVSAVEEALTEIVAAGVPFAVVFSAGFSETGSEGADRQQRIDAILRGGSTRLLGPNTTLNAFQPLRDDLAGPRLALITQSGHQGRPLYQAQEIGLPLAGWAPTGNEADLETAHFLRYFADREDVGAIAAYVEGFKDGPRLLRALDHAAVGGVPITIVKVGRTDVGRSWAQSHSGHLAGSDAVVTGVLRQYGVTRVDTLDELHDVSQMLLRSAPPQGDGIAIYSISGGTGAHLADLTTTRGMRLATLSSATQERLHEWIAPYLRVSNPVDSGGLPTGDERGPKILDAILADPDVALLLVPIAGSFAPISDALARDLVAAAKRTTKPVCVVWGSPIPDEPAYVETLLPSGLPVFRSVSNALTAIKAYLDHHAFRGRYVSPFGAHPAASPTESVRALLDGGGTLDEVRSKRIIEAYDIPVTRDLLCTTAEAAAVAAEEVGGPVVMKVVSPDLPHKSDHGLVALDVAPGEVRATYDALLDRAHAADPAAAVHGVLVCDHLAGGIELIVGLVRDELFGPAVLFGVGGVAVEVYGDVTFRVPPFTRDEARRMIEEVRGLPLLRGARGGPAVDLEAIVDVLMAVQRLAVDLGDEIVELDINPLLARPDGCVALDALVVVR